MYIYIYVFIIEHFCARYLRISSSLHISSSFRSAKMERHMRGVGVLNGEFPGKIKRKQKFSTDLHFPEIGLAAVTSWKSVYEKAADKIIQMMKSIEHLPMEEQEARVAAAIRKLRAEDVDGKFNKIWAFILAMRCVAGVHLEPYSNLMED